MGEVWRAEDTRLGRQVAIKVLPEVFTSDAELLPSGGLSNRQVGIAVSGSIFSDYEITPDGQSFIILQGGEGQTTQNHVTLVTHWFDVLRANLPVS